MERAKTEELLARRKKADGTAADQFRKEIGQIEDKLASLGARRTVLDEECKRLQAVMRKTAKMKQDLDDLRAEIDGITKVARKIESEVELLNVELQAPSRIQVIDEAAPQPEAPTIL